MKQSKSKGHPVPKPNPAKARIAVKVQPGASANRLLARTNNEWKITLTAPPIEGRANRACTEFLASLLRVPRSAVTIARGETSRRKLIEINGMLQAEVEGKLEHAAQESG